MTTAIQAPAAAVRPALANLDPTSPVRRLQAARGRRASRRWQPRRQSASFVRLPDRVGAIPNTSFFLVGLRTGEANRTRRNSHATIAPESEVGGISRLLA